MNLVSKLEKKRIKEYNAFSREMCLYDSYYGIKNKSLKYRIDWYIRIFFGYIFLSIVFFCMLPLIFIIRLMDRTHYLEGDTW